MHHINMKADLKSPREKLNLSTSEVALRLGVSQSTVVRLEQSADKGTISLSSLEKAVQALGCKLEIKILPPERRTTKYRGLKRTRSSANKASAIAQSMREAEERLDNSLTPEERIIRACKLSDFARSLR